MTRVNWYLLDSPFTPVFSIVFQRAKFGCLQPLKRPLPMGFQFLWCWPVASLWLLCENRSGGCWSAGRRGAMVTLWSDVSIWYIWCIYTPVRTEYLLEFWSCATEVVMDSYAKKQENLYGKKVEPHINQRCMWSRWMQWPTSKKLLIMTSKLAPESRQNATKKH